LCGQWTRPVRLGNIDLKKTSRYLGQGGSLFARGSQQPGIGIDPQIGKGEPDLCQGASKTAIAATHVDDAHWFLSRIGGTSCKTPGQVDHSGVQTLASAVKLASHCSVEAAVEF
jgi:hypothetical protein